MGFRDTILDLTSAPWLRTGDAEKYLYTIGLAIDCLAEKANQATKLHMPGLGDPSAIPYQGNDRLLVQGPAETTAEYLNRLVNFTAAWAKAGSSLAVIEQVQAYLSNTQQLPITAHPLPEMCIVSSNATIAKWDTLYNGSTQGEVPTHLQVTPTNWDWDGLYNHWWCWLILFVYPVAAGPSGSAASVTSTGGSGAPVIALINGATNANPTAISTISALGFNSSDLVVISDVAGNTGANGTHTITVIDDLHFSIPVDTSAGGAYTGGGEALDFQAITSGFATLTGLSGMTAANLYDFISVSGAASFGNNGVFQIVEVLSPTSVMIANAAAVASDANNGAIVWSVSHYPFIGPGSVWGAPNAEWGDITRSWGLSCIPQLITTIRNLVKRWKGSNAYYPDLIVAFDGHDGSPGAMFSPYSAAGSGNPDGTWQTGIKVVNGVVVPSRVTQNQFDAFCQGTGLAVQCSVENVN